jgi:F-type H+-transporting ATPase subunit delta
MRSALVANRYARALFQLAKEKNEQDAIFEQMRVIDDAFSLEKDIMEFVHSPLIRPSDKEKAMVGLTGKITVSDSLKNFLLLLARKNRLDLFPEIMSSFQQINDEANGVTRGTVRSATVLAPEERKRIEQLVGKATKKQVILTYKEDPTLLGGLVAEVGSFTFDDSLSAHLTRINEQLNRSAH